MAKEVFRVENPLVIMFEDGAGSIKCHIYPSQKGSSHREYGILVCDLVRHIARAFNVEEEDVWDYVDRERRRPTSPITQLS
jgi:hypothetical protein